MEKVGKGELNDELDQVELKHVHITRQLDSLIHFVYPDLHQTDPNSVILATLNTTIDSINDKITEEAPGVSTLYRLFHLFYLFSIAFIFFLDYKKLLTLNFIFTSNTHFSDQLTMQFRMKRLAIIHPSS